MYNNTSVRADINNVTFQNNIADIGSTLRIIGGNKSEFE